MNSSPSNLRMHKHKHVLTDRDDHRPPSGQQLLKTMHRVVGRAQQTAHLMLPGSSVSWSSSWPSMVITDRKLVCMRAAASSTLFTASRTRSPVPGTKRAAE